MSHYFGFLVFTQFEALTPWQLENSLARHNLDFVFIERDVLTTPRNVNEHRPPEEHLDVNAPLIKFTIFMDSMRLARRMRAFFKRNKKEIYIYYFDEYVKFKLGRYQYPLMDRQPGNELFNINSQSLDYIMTPENQMPRRRYKEEDEENERP